MAVERVGNRDDTAVRLPPVGRWRSPESDAAVVQRILHTEDESAGTSGAPQLPPVRLPGEAELARRARRSGILRELADLVAWVEANAPVTVGIGHVPVPAPKDVAAHGDWALALASGLLSAQQDLDGTHTVRTRAADDSDPIVLRSWLGVHVAVTELAEYASGPEFEARSVAEQVLAALLFGLYQGDTPALVEPEVARLAAEVLGDADVRVEATERPRLRAVIESAVHGALAQLVHHGSLVLHAGGGVELTPLGRWGVNRELNGAGIYAPVLGDYEHASPAALLDALSGYPENERVEEFHGWLAHRSQHDAAIALLFAAGTGDRGRRTTAADLLRRLGPAAESAVRDGLGDPLMWRHCCAWLTDRGLPPGRPLTDADRGWLLTDRVLALAGQHDPQDFIRVVGRRFTRRDVDLVVALDAGDHSERTHALSLLAHFHPDPHAADAARRAHG